MYEKSMEKEAEIYLDKALENMTFVNSKLIQEVLDLVVKQGKIDKANSLLFKSVSAFILMSIDEQSLGARPRST